MEKDEVYLIQLRDCFTAGYTLPQYCIDNGIKKPLFVSEKKFELFLWEVYVQFNYDKRLMPQFCFLNDEETNLFFPAHTAIVNRLYIKKFSDINLDNFDKIILLTNESITANPSKVIRFADLKRFFIRRTYVEIPLLKFLQRYPKVKLFVTVYPDPARFKGGTEFNSQLYTVSEFRQRLIRDKSGNVQTTLDKFGYTNAQVLEMASSPPVERKLDGSTVMIDDGTKLLHRVRNGKRVTAYQPEKFRNRIYFIGQCIYFGVYAPFDKTIESYLQKMLNKNKLPYRVENEGQFFAGRAQDLFYNLNNLNPMPGDIIFAFVEHQRINDKSIPFCDVSDAFDSLADFREIYCTGWHINELGYKLLAEKYFNFLTENNFFRDKEFKYPPPRVNRFIATVYRLGQKKAAQNLLSTRTWKLTKKLCARKNFRSARWS